MLTVGATLKQQRRNIVDYVTLACEAALRGEPPLTLVLESALRNKRLQAA